MSDDVVRQCWADWDESYNGDDVRRAREYVLSGGGGLVDAAGQFTRDRVAEDERRARAALAAEFNEDSFTCDCGSGDASLTWAGKGLAAVKHSAGYDHRAFGAAVVLLWLRNAPAHAVRALREAEAKWFVLEQAFRNENSDLMGTGAAETVEALAAIYRDHPDWCERWWERRDFA